MSSTVKRPRSSMKSAVIASMFTGTSLSACFVRVADKVSLADQPLSDSVEMMNGESVTISSFAVSRDTGLGATCASEDEREASGSEQAATTMRRSRRDTGEVCIVGVNLDRRNHGARFEWSAQA